MLSERFASFYGIALEQRLAEEIIPAVFRGARVGVARWSSCRGAADARYPSFAGSVAGDHNVVAVWVA